MSERSYHKVSRNLRKKKGILGNETCYADSGNVCNSIGSIVTTRKQIINRWINQFDK